MLATLLQKIIFLCVNRANMLIYKTNGPAGDTIVCRSNMFFNDVIATRALLLLLLLYYTAVVTAMKTAAIQMKYAENNFAMYCIWSYTLLTATMAT